jgi:hypothetical protein
MLSEEKNKIMSTNPPSMPPYPPPGGPGQGPGPYQPQYPGQYPPPPMKKKTSPIVWILVGLGAFFLLIMIAVVGAGFFVVHKAKQAGLDPDLMRRNPALATVKLAAALNPDIEILDINEDRGMVNVRDKKSGKTYTVNLEDAKKGKFSFQEDGKPPVTITTSGDKDGTVEIKSADGNMKIGGGQAVKVPTWMPDYPGSTPIGTYTAKSADGEIGNYTFKTSDSIDKVSSFYEEGLKSAGLKASSTISKDGANSGGIVSGENDSKSATVVFGTEGGQTTVNVTFKTKK